MCPVHVRPKYTKQSKLQSRNAIFTPDTTNSCVIREKCFRWQLLHSPKSTTYSQTCSEFFGAFFQRLQTPDYQRARHGFASTKGSGVVVEVAQRSLVGGESGTHPWVDSTTDRKLPGNLRIRFGPTKLTKIEAPCLIFGHTRISSALVCSELGIYE